MEERVLAKLTKRDGARRFHAFGVGPGKTGTHSLAAIFDTCYRSAHEPDRPVLMPLLTRYWRGEPMAESLQNFVRWQDQRLTLEMNASQFNSYLAPILIQEFPHAKFILTVRDCFSWANSVMNQDLNRSRALTQYEIDSRAARLGNPESWVFRPEEHILASNNLCPLDFFFRNWNERYGIVLEAIPADHLLVLKTFEITGSLAEIADFLEIPVGTLDAKKSASYRTPGDHGILAQIDPAFVNESATRICAGTMRQFFPGAALDVRAFLPST